MKSLVIIAHPHMEDSVINKRWKEELKKDGGITVHDLYAAYPDGKIDVKKEQALVDEHDNIVFQFPIYWYNCTPLLKQWMDEVLTPGWAYMGRYAFESKQLSLAVSTGGTADDYSHHGKHEGATIEEVLAPFRLSAGYLHARYRPAFTCHNAFAITPEELNQNAEDYLRFVKGVK